MKTKNKEIKQAITNLTITGFNFYIARQGSYDGEGRFSEVVAVLKLTVPRTSLSNGKTIETITINFRSAGSRRTTPAYSGKNVSLEMHENDLNYWMAGLRFPTTWLDINVSDSGTDYFLIYLFAAK